MISELLTVNDKKEVPTLTITGKESLDDKIDFINFISNKMVLSIDVVKERFNNINIQIKYQLLEDKYLEMRPSLIKIYKKR